MTTFIEAIVTCACCGTATRRSLLGSTNAFGSPDLDTRPPPMQRDTLHTWVQHCGHCGYCAPDLAKAPAGAAGQIADPAYRAVLADARLPMLARRFLAWAHLAVQCRLAALDHQQQARTAGQPMGSPGAVDLALQADLLRRCGRFADTLAATQAGLALKPDPVLAAVHAYQARLAAAGDDRCHRIEEAMDAVNTTG